MPPYRAAAFWIVALATLALRMYYSPPLVRDDASLLNAGEHRVVRVVDGDTIIVDPQVRLRLLGVNTPETVRPEYPVEPWGLEASDFTKRFVASGHVRLTFDRERVDRFGRSLAYVWVDDKLLNEELLRAGLARFEPQFHYDEAMRRRFSEAERKAKTSGLGIWSASR